MPPVATQSQSEILLLSDLEPAQLDDLREWLCYVKPIGPSIKITMTAASAGHGFSAVTAGTETGPPEEIVCESRLR
jgi:hypothetical protein